MNQKKMIKHFNDRRRGKKHTHFVTKCFLVFDNRSYCEYKILHNKKIQTVMTKYFNFLILIIIFLVSLTFDIVDNHRGFYEIFCGKNKSIPQYSNAPKNCKGMCNSNTPGLICLRGQCVSLWKNHTKLWAEFDKPEIRTTTEPTRLLLLKKRKKYGVGKRFNDYGMQFDKHIKK